MGRRDVLDDGQTESGPTGGPVSSGVDAIEALEDPVDLARRDADALVGDRDVDAAVVPARGHENRGSVGGVGDRVGHQVPDCDHDLLGVPQHLQAAFAGGHDGDLLGRRVDCAGVDRGGDHVVDTERLRSLERVVALEPRELDDLLDQSGQPFTLLEHPTRKALDRLGVVGCVVDGLRQQANRADGRLELVADVGDEVAADGLHPSLAGSVLDQRQHQPCTQRRHPGGHIARGQPGSAADHQFGLPDLAVPAHLPNDARKLFVDHLVAAYEA